jgi:hypothetical protein
MIDRERAETHLRLLAERELRHALDPAAPSSVTLGTSAVTTVSAVTHSLVAVGVLDTAAGRAIVNDLALALGCRRPRPDWIEVVVIGESAEVRATIPLSWG